MLHTSYPKKHANNIIPIYQYTSDARHASPTTRPTVLKAEVTYLMPERCSVKNVHVYFLTGSRKQRAYVSSWPYRRDPIGNPPVAVVIARRADVDSQTRHQLCASSLSRFVIVYVYPAITVQRDRQSFPSAGAVRVRKFGVFTTRTSETRYVCCSLWCATALGANERLRHFVKRDH